MILILTGSNRNASLNKRLAQAAEKYLQGKGVSTTLVDLKDYDIPLLDIREDEVPQTPPEAVVKVRTLFESHQGILFVTPEYNGNLTPLLLNAIDSVFNYVYFPKGPLTPLQNKVVSVASASPSKFGGLKAITILKGMLSHMGALVSPTDFALPLAHEAFTESGELKEASLQKQLETAMEKFSDLVGTYS